MPEPSISTFIICSDFNPINFSQSRLDNLGDLYFVFKTQSDVDVKLFTNIVLMGDEYAEAKFEGYKCFIYFGKIVTDKVDSDFFLFVYKDAEVCIPDNYSEKIKDKVFSGWFSDYMAEDHYEYVKNLYPPFYIVKAKQFNQYGLELKNHGLFYKEKAVTACLTQR